MSLSNLSILVLIAAVVLFVSSLRLRRSGGNNPTLRKFVMVMRIVVLVLAAIYFYMRFAG